MSLPTDLSKDSVLTVERRNRVRETPSGVVLVFLENANWGKLIEIHEDGMSFEFDHLPPLRQRINFTFQIMGCMPMPPAGEEFGVSFQAVGEVLWTRGFERTAGVRFVDLTQESREQIRELLAFGKAGAELEPIQEVQMEVLDLGVEPSESQTHCSKAPTVAEVVDEALTRWKATPSIDEPPLEPSQSMAVQDLPAVPETKSSAPRAEAQIAPQPKVSLHPLVVRQAALVVVASSIVAIAVFGAIPTLMRARRASEVAPAASVPPPVERVRAVKNLFAESSRPFQVEVLEVSGKKWMLDFVRDASARTAGPSVAKSAAPAHASLELPKTTSFTETRPAEKSEAARNFALVAPKLTSPTSTAVVPSTLSAEPPALSVGFTASFKEPITTLLPGPASPASAAKTLRTGGDVHQARLLKSVSPDYPPMARKAGIDGDVVMDAVIDPAGNVTAVKVISGPPLLRDAAVEALSRWKYEAARLDGAPVSMNLRVALRFRVN